MTIHRFAIDTGQLSPGKFTSVLESSRSDVEQRHTKIALHDEESADIRYARQLADEIIHVSGAEIEVYLRTDNADNDSVWDADADPTYWQPILMGLKQQLANDPYIDQEALTRRLLYAYFNTEGEDLMIEETQQLPGMEEMPQQGQQPGGAGSQVANQVINKQTANAVNQAMV